MILFDICLVYIGRWQQHLGKFIGKCSVNLTLWVGKGDSFRPLKMYTFMWCQIVSHAEQQPRVLDESHRSSSTFCTFKCVRQFSTKYSRTPFPLKPVFYGDLALNFSRKHLSFPLSNFLLPSAKVWALKVQHHVFNFPAHLSTCRVLERRQMQFFLTVSSICRFPQGLLWCTRSRLVLIGNPFFMKTANDLDFFFFSNSDIPSPRLKEKWHST